MTPTVVLLADSEAMRSHFGMSRKTALREAVENGFPVRRRGPGKPAFVIYEEGLEWLRTREKV